MANLVTQQTHFLLDPEFCEPHDYSQMALFFAAIPWMTYNKSARLPDFIRREFTYGNQTVVAIISGARLQEGQPIQLPGVVEERVLDALIKISAEGNLIDPSDANEPNYGVHFSIYQLEQHLRRFGHVYNYTRINQALDRLASTLITLIDPNTDKPIKAKFPILSTLQIHEKRGECYARFNPLITDAIQDTMFRLYNYRVLSLIDNNLARWIARRLYRAFKQAAVGVDSRSYHFLTSSLIDGSPFAKHSRGWRRNAEQVEEALDCLIVTAENPNGILSNWEVTNNAEYWDDPKFEVFPSPMFVQDIKRANAAINTRSLPTEVSDSPGKRRFSTLLKLPRPDERKDLVRS